MEDRKKVTKLHRVPQINISFILLVFIFIYLLFHAFSLFTGKHTAVTEVKQGQIVSDNRYRALALRSETLVSSDSSGEAYYYLPGESRVKKNETVLSLDSTGDLIQEIKNSRSDDSDLTEDQQARLTELLKSYNDSYTPDTFGDVYTFRQNVSDYLSLINGEQVKKSLSADLKKRISSGDVTNIRSPSAGLMCLSFDNLNGLTEDSFTADSFDEKKLVTTEVSSGKNFSDNDTVFRLVTDDDWKLVIPVSESKAEELKSENVIEVLFEKDSATAWGNSHIVERSGKKYLVLEFDDSMDRYADSRFLDVELLLEKKSGLKVPDSSLVTRILYQIPNDYITTGENGKSQGVLVKQSDGSIQFNAFTIKQTSDDRVIWATFHGASNLNSIVKSSSGTGELSLNDCNVKKTYGVYLANKGYAQFVQVRVMYENGQYSIIEPVNGNSLRLYDFIVLDASGVKNGEMLNQT